MCPKVCFKSKPSLFLGHTKTPTHTHTHPHTPKSARNTPKHSLRHVLMSFSPKTMTFDLSMAICFNCDLQKSPTRTHTLKSARTTPTHSLRHVFMSLCPNMMSFDQAMAISALIGIYVKHPHAPTQPKKCQKHTQTLSQTCLHEFKPQYDDI